MKYIITFLFIVCIGFSGYYFINFKKEPLSVQNVPVENPSVAMGYVYKNISKLSPEKEALGGTFYVTNITADAGSGTVNYEDGHNAFVADFSYVFSKTEEVEITSFEIVE